MKWIGILAIMCSFSSIHAEKLRILVVGCGHMGTSHARAYKAIDDFELVGVVAPSSERRDPLAKELSVPAFDNFEAALKLTQPDAVCIATYPDTHARYAILALSSGAHVFLEKPIGCTLEEAEQVFEASKKYQKKVVVGFILQHHPAWNFFIEKAQELGSPLVMRMNLNQQSEGANWQTHQKLLQSLSPLVDCGIHYIDVMCQMTNASPVSVYAIGARLTPLIDEKMYNYGSLHVVFDDGSVGWYEAGWGPMMSQTSHFIKDVIGPKGSVSMVPGEAHHDSANVDSHTLTNALLVHSAELNPEGHFAHTDQLFSTAEEPSHNDLCVREQLFFLNAIKHNLNLDEHLRRGIRALAIVLAADRSVRTKSVEKIKY